MRARAISIAVLMVVAFSGTTAQPAAAETEGLEVDGSTTYRLDPSGRRVHVSVKLDLVNTMPSETQGAYISTPYFDSFTIPALGSVRNIEASSSAGGSLSTTVEEGSLGLQLVVIDLSPNLVHGVPQTVNVEFDLIGEAPRSRSVTRVNGGFASWFVFAAGDAGAVDVTLDVPAAFDLSVSERLPLDSSRQGNRKRYRMADIADLDKTYFFASASNPDGLVEQRLPLGNTDVTIKGWPGDVRWRTFAARWTRRGFPALQKMIGVDAPEEDLSIVESSRSYQLGYAGFYAPALGTVEVGDALDETVVLHELSHVWFNQYLFSERWLCEGLAEEVSNRALKQLGRKRTNPKPIKPGGRGAVRLNAWPPPAPLDPKRAAVEDFAYNASYAVVNDVLDEIGLKGLRKIVAAATEHHIPYQGDTEPEDTRTERDWRYFYDLAELLAESKNIESLFRKHVLTADEVTMLDDRADAREDFEALVEAGDGWSPPFEVRETMAQWSFHAAESRIRKATELLERARAAGDQLAAVDIDAMSYLEAEYEGADSLDDYEAVLDEVDATTDDVVAVHDRVDALNPVARIGLLGADLRTDDMAAVIADGELDAVPEILASANETMDGATRRGALVLVAGVLLLLLVMATVLTTRRRRRRRQQQEAQPPQPDLSLPPTG